MEHCDRCGKKLGGEGDIHTCTPKADPIGDAQDRLIAEMAAQPKQEPVAIDWDTKTDTPIMGYATPPAAPVQPVQPEQEPVACLSKTQAKAILDLALDLEKTGRMVVLTKGQERTDFAARNRNIQCALEDALRNATTPPAAQPESVQPVSMYEDWYDSNSCSHCGMVGGHVKTCRHYITPPAAAQRQWTGLTDEEWQDLSDRYGMILFGRFKNEIEDKLKEKNT